MKTTEELSIILDSKVKEYSNKGYTINTQNNLTAKLSKPIVRGALGATLLLLWLTFSCIVGILELPFTGGILTISTTLCIAIPLAILLAASRIQISLEFDEKQQILESKKLKLWCTVSKDEDNGAEDE